MPKPRTIMLLAGLAAVVVIAGVGLSWKEIYYAIWPEARFWGQWVWTDAPSMRADGRPMRIVRVEFQREGGVLIRDSYGEAYLTKYNVAYGSISFPDSTFRRLFDPPRLQHMERLPVKWVTVSYQFESDDVLVLEKIVREESFVLRRLADCEDAEP